MKIHFLLLFAVFCVSACGDGRDRIDPNNKLLAEEVIECRFPAYAAIFPWEGVLALGCEVDDGPLVTVENGYVQLRGQSKLGRKVGIWIHVHNLLS